MVLAHEPADAGNFRHAFDAADLIAQIPILKAAQLGQIIFPRFIDQRVLKDPADAAGIWSKCRGYARREATARLIQIFENAASGPINIGAVFKNNVNIRVPEVGKAAHRFYSGSRNHGGHDRISYLIFDDGRVSPHPWRIDDHLNVGEIGYGIQRRVFQRPQSPGTQKNNHEKYEKFVSRASFDNFFDHRVSLLLGRQLEPLLNFLLTRPPDSDRHVPCARHCEIRFGLVDAVF